MGVCQVLLGSTDNYVLLIPRRNTVTGEEVYGILVEEPVKIRKFRNILWHEMGHVKGGKSKDPVINEFLADRWAVDTALKKGFTIVAEEILLRCSDFLCDESISMTYKKAARKVISHFRDFAADIVHNYS